MPRFDGGVVGLVHMYRVDGSCFKGASALGDRVMGQGQLHAYTATVLQPLHACKVLTVPLGHYTTVVSGAVGPVLLGHIII